MIQRKLMFEEIEKLTNLGTVIFGTSNSGGKCFCMWQQRNSFVFTSGLLEDIELNDGSIFGSGEVLPWLTLKQKEK